MSDWTPKLGDGATVCHYSDRTACTVIKVSASGFTAPPTLGEASRDSTHTPKKPLKGFAFTKASRLNGLDEKKRRAKNGEVFFDLHDSRCIATHKLRKEAS